MHDPKAHRTATLGDIARFVMGQSPPSEFICNELDNGLPFLQGNADFGSAHPRAKQSCRKPLKVCEPGDVLISVRAPVGAINVADRNYCIGRGLAAVRFMTANPAFGTHALRFVASDLRRVAQGTTFEAVGRRELSALQIWVPLLQEQRQIATILDTVDDAIHRTEQVIAKLKQVKQGLLHDLLTRGMDDNGELRDPEHHPEQFKNSPLGRIPKDWDVAPFAAFASPTRPYLKTGPFGSSLKQEHWVSEGVPVVTIGSLGEGEFIRSELLHVSERTARALSAYALIPGDIVFSRVADVGRSVVVTENEYGWIMSSNMMWIALDKGRIVPAYVQANIAANLSVRQQIVRLVNASGRDIANATIINQLQLPWAPREEQARIARVLDEADKRSRAEQNALAKLRVLKNGFMEDLLTGRVRVTKLLEMAAE